MEAMTKRLTLFVALTGDTDTNDLEWDESRILMVATRHGGKIATLCLFDRIVVSLLALVDDGLEDPPPEAFASVRQSDSCLHSSYNYSISSWYLVGTYNS